MKEWGGLKVRVQLLADVLQGTPPVSGNPASTFPSDFLLTRLQKDTIHINFKI